MKSKGVAYLLWLFSFFGWLGFHRFYLEKYGTGILWILTGGLFGFGSFYDLFTLGGKVDMYNTQVELKTIRETTSNIGQMTLSGMVQNQNNQNKSPIEDISNTFTSFTNQIKSKINSNVASFNDKSDDFLNLSCPSCLSKISRTDLFCRNCGTSVKSYIEMSILTNCPSCNNLITQSDAFCSNCGYDIRSYKDKFISSKFISSNSYTNYSYNICPNCSNQINSEDIFCENCGFKLK